MLLEQNKKLTLEIEFYKLGIVLLTLQNFLFFFNTSCMYMYLLRKGIPLFDKPSKE